MQLKLDRENTEPLHGQIAAQIRRLLASGELRPGTLLPSVRMLARQHAINPMTVSKAYGSLVDAGMLERKSGIGMAVACCRIADDERMAMLAPALTALAMQSAQLGLSRKAVLDALDDRLTQVTT
jgi:GntR family transcriptional regulator